MPRTRAAGSGRTASSPMCGIAWTGSDLRVEERLVARRRAVEGMLRRGASRLWLGIEERSGRRPEERVMGWGRRRVKTKRERQAGGEAMQLLWSLWMKKLKAARLSTEGHMICQEATQVIVPLGALYLLGYKIRWEEGFCRIKHASRGPLPVRMRQFCPRGPYGGGVEVGRGVGGVQQGPSEKGDGVGREERRKAGRKEG